MTDDVLGTPANTDQNLDEALGGNPDVEDITNDVTPEDFDFDAFVDGVRPGRRAVRVMMRADLAAEVDQIAIQVEELGDDEEEAAEQLMDQFYEIQRQIKDSTRVFVVEGRSDERRRQIEKNLEKLGHQKPGKKAPEEEHAEFNRESALHILADAIVVPSNISVEGLRKLNSVADSEVNKLFGAFADASSRRSAGVTPNLSRRR